jgi:GUN4-like
VLGGLAAVKRNLASRSSQVRIQALSEAIKYESEGIKLIEQIVKIETGAVQWAAYNLLWERENEALKKELLEYFPLESALGINYSKLRDLLAVEDWEEANEETYRVMRQIVGEYGWHIQYFPCEDLRTIDQLWVKSSCDRFGFSVQKRIYRTLGGSWKNQKNRKSIKDRLKDLKYRNDWKTQGKIWEVWGDRIGWRQHGNWIAPSDLNFSINAPAGHLPVWWRQDQAPARDDFLTLASRIDTCRIS